ncbi:tetratricopeptide repeat protein [Cryomorpha ignava]|uniref:histidine kinase n=1 Tax=Cryomorpha ignava TaxID=101383 RepID=A0A7K3WSG2_9FLAO|nr:ATP-binding protein [Cryomorpha ignava]NEN24396.1 tetratricopeptide repeat protein [Cryomorpha ignava]
MKSPFALFLIWLIPGGVFAQDASLVPQDLHEFQTLKSDSGRCVALIHACFNSSRAAPAEGVGYGKKAIVLATEGDFEKLLADAHNSIGQCYDTYGKADSAMFHFKTSLTLLEKSGYKCDIAAVYANIGTAHRRIGEYTKALKSFTKCLEIQEDCGELANRGMVLQSIGSSYNSLQNYDKAIEYFDAAIAMEEAHGIESRLGPIYQSKANSYLGLKRLDEATRLTKMAILSFAKSGNEYNLAYSFESLAHIQLEQEKLDSAIYYGTRALTIFQGMNATIDIVYEQIFISELLLKAKDYQTAKSKLLEILPITVSENLPHDRMSVMELLSKVYAEMGDYKLAYEYQFKQMALKDSLNVDEQKTEMTALVNKFETDKRDKQIALEQAQKAQIQAESDRQKQQKYFLLIGVILLSLLIMVLINRYLQKQKNARELALVNVQMGKEKARAERSERMKQEFLSNMSHEIRTPLNAINGLSHLLLDQQHDTKTQEFLQAINHSGEHLMVILNDILDVAKVEAGKLDILQNPICLTEELKMVYTIYHEKAAEKGLSLTVFVDDTIPDLLLGDAARLSQVLGNLVSNAIKFTKSGRIEVRVENSGNNTFLFSVEDSGVGISAENVKRIFESFEQVTSTNFSQVGGTGLGLTIARKLVELMGGNLHLKTEPGKGSQFYFSLKLVPDDGVSEKIPEIQEIVDKTFHIIVAEDNEYNFWVTQGVLQKHFPNAAIYRAKTGNEVLDLLDEDEYDLIIMDVQMPELDGLKTTELLRQRRIEIPVLGLTASVLKEEQEKCLTAGMNGFVQKPFKAEVITGILWQLLQPHHQPKVGIADDRSKRNDDQFLKYMPENLIKFEEGFKKKELATIKSVSHQMRPLSIDSGMKELNATLIELENANLWDAEVEREIETVITIIRAKLNQTTKNTE